jgi:hypothetical protein
VTGQVSVLVGAAIVATGCGMGDDVINGIGMTTSDTATLGADMRSIAEPPTGEVDMVVTPVQRAYLDALSAAGVRPSSELFALTIGSYVCQARAANQTDQAVWDFVLPMVRNDVRSSQSSSVPPASGEVNSTTSDYIRIASDKLC